MAFYTCRRQFRALGKLMEVKLEKSEKSRSGHRTYEKRIIGIKKYIF